MKVGKLGLLTIGATVHPITVWLLSLKGSGRGPAKRQPQGFCNFHVKTCAAHGNRIATFAKYCRADE